ncbi:MAG: hypothetical protein QNJ12_17080 [Ilumatobacter sp.]|uniref:hypothetical protein n=1 Tax=Ilumatobacter sp. TaxID=1967498 RepID=UPI002624026E|nr:hypothetical protein [Ilumatobacter sp.]MDJ0770510.1 hypothetical protein [Ilumatobacter sp.]
MTDRIDEPDADLDPDVVPADGFGEWFDSEFGDDAGVGRTTPGAPDEHETAAPTVERIEAAPTDRSTDEPVTEPDDDGQTPLLTRVGRRIVRRPSAWMNRPWPPDRILRYVVTFVTLSVTTYVMMNVVHLSPFPGRDLIFDDTTPTGGDFGAHVWGPAYLRDHLLGDFRLNGWTMDWYGGMPAYRFYMVLPALAILLVDIVLPYGVAMKLVAVLGLITLPAACWAFGRLADFRYPMPELFAVGGLAFALDESFSIYGGNLKSTMAGEFSFSIALSLGMLGLGLLAAGLRTGKYRVWASVLIAAACVSHGIVLIFVVAAALVFCLVWIDRTRLVYALTVGITSLLLIMWWAGPFLLDHEYMTDMKYGARPSGADDSFWDMFFPLTAPLDVLITTLAVIGFVMSIVRRHLNGAALGVVGLVFVAGVYLARDSLPVIGLLWNPRLLPFVYLVRYLLMMVGAVEILGLFWNAIRDRRALALPSTWEGTTFAGATTLGTLAVLGFMFQVLPFGENQQVDGSSVYTWGPFHATDTNTDALGDGWSTYNFRGYEGRDQYYTEYHQVVTTMERIGDDPQLGCGRAMWENNGDNGQYGTTMALMLLPHWTDGCIGSMEGLFFEASGTTPYHFLTAAAISKQSSNPVRELRYANNDAQTGVRHLQDLGVRYLMVRTPEAKAEAAGQAELSYITTSAPWDIYLVDGADIVVPLDTQPVVVRGRSGDARERNLELGTSWFQHPDEWAAMPADDGPDDWQRISVQVDLSRREGEPGDPGRRVDIVTPVEAIQPIALPDVAVSNVDIGQQSLAFDVDRVGVPVLVRVGYFPNWNASGADGPYRVGPNMMVVVPRDTRVELDYGRSGVDYLTLLLTLIGVGLCVLWRVRGDVVHAGEVPAAFAGGSRDEPGDKPAPPPDDVSGGDVDRDIDHAVADDCGEADSAWSAPVDAAGPDGAPDDSPDPSDEESEPER